LFVVALLTTTSLCQAGPEENKADAQAAFELGRKLVLRGKFAEACPKFEESERLDPGLGTMLFLADCYEKTGKTASAWGQFREAEAIAIKESDSREQIAHDRAIRLEPKLSKVILQVDPANKVEGLHVTRDGDDIGEGVWNTPLPIDPGPHELGASAPGKTPWTEHVEIANDASTITVAIPKLADEPNAVAPLVAVPIRGPVEPPPEEPKNRGNTQRILGLSAMGVGVAAGIVGTVFGVVAKSKNATSNDGPCNANTNLCVSQQGVDERSAAKTDALVSTIAFIGAGVFVAGGAVLYFTAPTSKRPVAGLVPSIGPQSAGLQLGGSF
ncbi:MAG: tetratricopeptide repeat protein, partial [Polyangiaceae bacterium]